ncbi:MAG: sigma 54-interacting transcriptional regulator, partial [Pseudomonadota bacterium]
MESAENLNTNNVLFMNRIPIWAKDVLHKRGLRPGDNMIISPMQGNQRVLTLKYAQYNISSSDGHQVEQKFGEIRLPMLPGHIFEFSLILCRSHLDPLSDTEARYFLRANSSLPFRLNGSFSYFSFLERGDQVMVGLNKMHFTPPGESDNHQQQLLNNPILSDENLLRSDMSILLEGETGTGKTFLAKKIHEYARRPGRLVHLNLSSFSTQLLESEIFGHIKGAFTSAINSKRGALLEADRGTLFLDEIDSLNWEIQTKLLLFLDSKEVRPVGGDRAQQVDVRLIFASG